MWNNEKAKKLLKQRGLERKELARFCGIELQSLNNMLCSSEKIPSRPVLILMAQALHTKVEELDPEQARTG